MHALGFEFEEGLVFDQPDVFEFEPQLTWLRDADGIVTMFLCLYACQRFVQIRIVRCSNCRFSVFDRMFIIHMDLTIVII